MMSSRYLYFISVLGNCQRFLEEGLFNLCTNLLAGLIRLVLLVLFAWRILVLALVFFIRWACATSGAALQSLTCGTVRPFLGPLSHLQLNLAVPLEVLFQTILCSDKISQAFMLAYDECIPCTAGN
jgi:hypothetical protein